MKTRRIGLRSIILGLGIAYALSSSIPAYSETSNQDLECLARENIANLNSQEKKTLVEKLGLIESSNDNSAVNVVYRKNKSGKIIDTVYSIGQNQINISKSGALADYNDHHKEDFTREEMLDPVKNQIVSEWYIFSRLPKLLEDIGIEATVVNVAASYNAGAGKVKQRGGDALTYFSKLPKITKGYLRKMFGERLFK